MAKLNKWDCAELWATTKALLTVDLKDLHGRIGEE